jgi:hypothetical protein
MDLTHDPAGGFDSYAFAEMLRRQRDPRIKYVISNRRIFSSEVTPWEWRRYNGTNPHDHHVHISVLSDKAHYDDVRPWDISNIPASPPQPDRPPAKPTLRLGSSGEAVLYLQRMLGAKPTGMFDAATEGAVQEFQKRYGLIADGIVGPQTWKQLEE